MPARLAPRRGRHAAPRRTRAVVLPALVLLAVAGTAGAADQGPAAAVAAPAPSPVAVVSAVAVGSSLELPSAERASRSRRVEPEPPAPAPVPAPAFVRPVDGPETSPYGTRWGRLHAGLDFGVPVGTPVRAVADGIVTAMPYDAGGYGNHVQLLLADGTVVVLGHLSEELVTAGPVVAGQVIALSGDTGHSTGPHLHFELRSPTGPFDPRPWLESRGIVV